MEQYVIGRNNIALAYNGKLMGRYGYTLPAFTLRIEFPEEGYYPVGPEVSDIYWSKVVGAPTNQWDFTYPYSDWSGKLTNLRGSDGQGNKSTFRVIDAGDMSAVTNMHETFLSAYMTETCLFDTSNVTDMNSMFRLCTVLEGIPEFPTYSVTDMGHFMDECVNVVAIPSLYTAKVTNMEWAFHSCSALKSIGMMNTSNVVNMSYAFYATTSLDTIPAIDTSSVTDMSFMFDSSGITSLPMLDTRSVVTMESMLYGCKSLAEIPTFNTINVKNMEYMAAECTSLRHVPLFDVSSIESISSAFQNCTNVESGAYALYQRASTEATHLTSHSAAFKECGSNTSTGASELAQIPSDWK